MAPSDCQVGVAFPHLPTKKCQAAVISVRSRVLRERQLGAGITALMYASSS